MLKGYEVLSAGYIWMSHYSVSSEWHNLKGEKPEDLLKIKKKELIQKVVT